MAPGKAVDTAQGEARFVNDYLGYLLGQANHALFKDFEAEVKAAGISSLAWRVLATLSDQSPMPVGQLAQEVLSQQPTVTKLLQRLCADGWVRLSDDPADQRRTLVAITSEGLRVIAPLLSRAMEHEQRVLAGLGQTQVRQLKEQLRRLGRLP